MPRDDVLGSIIGDAFDEATIEAGKSLRGRGAVQQFVDSDNTIAALVQDEATNAHVVAVPRDPEDGLPDPFLGDCTCGEALCEHVAATLLAYADRAGPPKTRVAQHALGTQRNALEELDLIRKAQIPRRETVIPLGVSSVAPYPGFAETVLSPRRAAAPIRNDRWRVVFGVSLVEARDRYEAKASREYKDRPFLIPGAQRIRKNGEPGKVERYQADRITEPVDAAAALLLSRLMVSGGAAPLLAHWDWILEHPEIPIFACDADGKPLHATAYRLRKVERATIRLMPTLERGYGDERLVLRARLRCRLEEPDQPQTALEPVWAEAWQGRLVMALGLEYLAWLDGDPGYASLVSDLVNQSPELTAEDGQYLRRRFSADSPARYELDYAFEAIRVVRAPPAPSLVLSDDVWPGQTVVSFHFNYTGESGVRNRQYVLLARDEATERKTVEALIRLFGHSAQTYQLPPEDRPVTVRRIGVNLDLQRFLIAFGEALLSRGIEVCLRDPRARIARGGRLLIATESGVDWFALRASAGEEIDLRGLRADDPLFATGLVRSGGKLVYLGKDDVEKLRALLLLMEPDADEPRVSARDLAAMEALCSLVDDAPPDLTRRAAVAKALSSATALPELPVPRGLTATLRSYQVTGYRWLAFLSDNGLNGCLADDMGLGKTVQALAFLLRRKEAGVPGPSLVVAPVSTLRNWEREAGRFAPVLRVAVHHGPGRDRETAAFARYDLIVVSYATLRADAALLQAMVFDSIVLDEAQTIKNPASQSFAACKGLQSRQRITLTGTPLENSVLDLWAQLDFLEPRLLGSLSRFRREYGSAREGPQVQRLKRMIRPFILRRTKDVVESSLPPKEEMTLYAEMGSRQRAAYQAIRAAWRERIVASLKAKGAAGSGALIFEGLLRLRQAACFPSHVDPSYRAVPSCKLELLCDTLEEILSEGHRVLVFSQFVESLGEIRKVLEARSTAFAYLDGSTRNRQEIIDSFQRPDGPPVFLLSLKAGGVGVNLTAADYVVVFDPWWNPAIESQAVDRTHRIGQTKPVFVYRIVTRESIEEQILELQDRKRALAQELIEQNPRSLLSLSEEQILGFFQEPGQ